MVRIALSSETWWLPSPYSAIRAAVMAWTDATALRSMQGIWTSPPIGSQVSPRLCSMPISAAFSTCSGVPPRTSRETAGRHRAGRADLALAADLGAGDRGVLLEQHADRGRGQQEPHDAVVVGAGHEPRVVVQDRGDDPGGAVGRRGDHPPAGGVLLVDGQGVEVDPVQRAQRVAAVVDRPARLARSAGARRRTFSPPGSTPVDSQPFATHSCITDQMCSRPARICSSVRHDSSFAIMTSLIGSRSRAQCSSSSLAAGEREGRPVSGRPPRVSAAASSSTTKPPPTE